jgi:fluoride ion exporter CrcB/FEX
MKKVSRNIAIKYGVGLGSLVGAGTASAALPPGAAGAFTTLSTDALALVDLAWTVAIPVAVAFIILKLFKKAASSAT